MLSMEMHCTPNQQRQLAVMLVQHLGEALVPYDELEAIAQPACLSPHDLIRRILLKGKIKKKRPPGLTHDTSRCSTSPPMARRCATRATSLTLGVPGAKKRERWTSGSDSVFEMQSRRSSRLSLDRVSADDKELAVEAMQTFAKRDNGAKAPTDEYYASFLTLRSVPVAVFTGDDPPLWPLQISSINEDKLLLLIGIDQRERHLIEDLQQALKTRTRRGGFNGEQLAAQAIARLAADPPSEVGGLQRRTTTRLLRLFPLGLRFSGNNMSPLPCWLCGAQSVALNMSQNDTPVQLHHTLFKRSGGFVLKPPDMTALHTGSIRTSEITVAATNDGPTDATADEQRITDPLQSAFAPKHSSSDRRCAQSTEPHSSQRARYCFGGSARPEPHSLQRAASSVCGSARDTSTTNVAEGLSHQEEHDYFWPPFQSSVHITSIRLLSLHTLPKRGEHRPRYDGRCGACHKYHPELSGSSIPPTAQLQSSPALRISLHPIGGFCAVSRKLPLPPRVDTEVGTQTVKKNGLSAIFDDKVHCAAAEPYATFLRVQVVDGGEEVAYETAVLGRLRSGYRILQLRAPLGTRIELCYLFLHVATGTIPNQWITSRQWMMS
mmetsp:Transcript_64229/g.191742  ORF Transcript_64229/g.191742 Transcript_64229/m.191742 type:complete len:606 (+) Transcript_64229:5599-7416(+)